MNVLGHEIPESAIASVIEGLKRRGFFAVSTVEMLFKLAGVPEGEVAMRAADRLIQKLRRNGEIEFAGRDRQAPWRFKL